MLLRLALELLCIITSVTSDRYQLVPRPLDSVIPERFYEQNGRVNQPPLITLTEPETIQNEPLYMLIIVRSSSHHFQRRDAIRLTWGNVSDTAEGRVSLVFVVGKSADPTVHSLLLLESQQHKDLLYVGFEDTYANLTLKDLAVFQYARKLMAHCQYLAIAGDEIVLDISGVVQFLADAYDDVAINQHQSGGVRELSICYEFPCCTPVIRENSSKYLVQNGYYEGTLYPSYCSGTFFVIHMGLVGEIYNMMLDTPFFMPDDVWLGIIYQKLGIRLHDSHLNFAGISSYKRELRLLKLAKSPEFYNNRVFVTILDYAFKTENVASKIIEMWSIIGTQKRLGMGQVVRPPQYNNFIWVLAIVILLFLVYKSPFKNWLIRYFIFSLWSKSRK